MRASRTWEARTVVCTRAARLDQILGRGAASMAEESADVALASTPAPRPGAHRSQARIEKPGTPWNIGRLEYALLAAATLLIAAFALLFFLFGFDLQRVNDYGYAGLFAVSLISAASIVLPMPGAAAVTGAGAVLDPALGIPVPILVGLVAGVAEALGELTGYAAGYGGSRLFRDRPSYARVRRWMERRGLLTIFLLASFPNPLLDVAGLAAGAVRFGLRRFFAGILAGKIFKNIYLASGGLALAEAVRRLF